MTAVLRAYGADLYGAGTYGGVVVDDEPSWVVEALGATGQWIDLTCDVRSIRVDRGRSSWVEAFKAGTLEVVLANPDGRYSTFPASSVWLQPGGFTTDVPIRAGSIVAGEVEWRFTGTTDSVYDQWPGTTDALATVVATDAFKMLARHNGGPRTAVGAGELSGARIHRLADDAAYTGPRSIDTGLVALQATTLDGVTVDLMRQVGESEWGWLYMTGDGTLRFRQRDADVTDPRMATVQWTVTDKDVASAPPSTPTTPPPERQEPFDDLTAWFTIAGTPTLVAGRTGTALRLQGSTTTAGYSFAVEDTAVCIGFALKMTTLALNQLILALWSDENTVEHGTLWLANTSGAVKYTRAVAGPILGTTANGVIAADTWVYLELRVVMDDAAGQVTIRANGVEVLNVTGVDTRNAGTKAVFDTLRLRSPASGNTNLFDDLVIGVGAGAVFRGDVTIPPGVPTVLAAAADPDEWACYGEATIGADSDRIINVAQVTPPGHTLSTFTDAASKAWFGPRTWTRTDLPINADVDALALCQAVVGGQKNDDRRIDAVVIDGANRPNNVAVAHGARITDRMRFIRTYPGGWQVDAELHIHGRTDEVLPVGDGRHLAAWTVTLATASAASVANLAGWDVGTWDESQWGV